MRGKRRRVCVARGGVDGEGRKNQKNQNGSVSENSACVFRFLDSICECYTSIVVVFVYVRHPTNPLRALNHFFVYR